MAKGTVGIVIGWVDTAIGWIKKGVRNAEVNNIDNAVATHNDERVSRIVRNIKAKRKKRANSA